MTKEALKFSDRVIITDDNPRMENPAQIRKDMMKNLSYIEKKKLWKLLIEKKAIIFAINLLKKMDYLLIAGKGHENYQLIGNKRYFFSDKLIVKKIINCKNHVGLKQINQALGIKESYKYNFKFGNVSIDSRNLDYKSLFIPIKGQNYDGHNFIDHAASKGVKFSLVEKNKKHLVTNKKIHLIEVHNTQNSLTKLAKYIIKKTKKLRLFVLQVVVEKLH